MEGSQIEFSTAASLEIFILQEPATSRSQFQPWLFLALFSLLLVLPVVEAVEAGHAIALLLGVILSITGICACLGVYARKKKWTDVSLKGLLNQTFL